MTERGGMVALGGAFAWLAAVHLGFLVCRGVILTSMALFVDAARTGRISGVPRAPVPLVWGS